MSFYKNRKLTIFISGAIMLLGIICIFVRGIKFDIQFVGGSISKYSYSGDIDMNNAASLAKEAVGGREVTAQITNNEATGDLLVLNIAGKGGVTVEQQKAVTTALTTAYPDSKIALEETNNVESFIGKKFAKNSILSISLASLLIVLYVWFRFRKISSLSLGVFGLVALVHDCLVVFFAFVIFGIPLNDAFVAVVLTIIGYSINDTVVIYDRIRENSRLVKPGTPIEDLVDKSINQSLSRSINTSVTTFTAIAIILVFAMINGISSITNFALPMMVGVISGCYSTIFVAAPFWAVWQKSKEKRKAKQRLKKA